MLLRLPPGGNLLPLDHKLNGGERGREVNVEFNCQLGKISTGFGTYIGGTSSRRRRFR